MRRTIRLAVALSVLLVSQVALADFHNARIAEIYWGYPATDGTQIAVRLVDNSGTEPFHNAALVTMYDADGGMVFNTVNGATLWGAYSGQTWSPGGSFLLTAQNWKAAQDAGTACADSTINVFSVDPTGGRLELTYSGAVPNLHCVSWGAGPGASCPGTFPNASTGPSGGDAGVSMHVSGASWTPGEPTPQSHTTQLNAGFVTPDCDAGVPVADAGDDAGIGVVDAGDQDAGVTEPDSGVIATPDAGGQSNVDAGQGTQVDAGGATFTMTGATVCSGICCTLSPGDVSLLLPFALALVGGAVVVHRRKRRRP